MKKLLLLAAILAYANANGYYYQQSSSKSSSSSYKNNELQHQTEDESHFSKHGDTAGREKPKVNTYSQHIEYQNPTGDNSGQTAYRPDDSDAYAARQAVGSDGIVRTVSGNRDQYSYHATYGTSGGTITPLTGGTYDTESNLLSLTQGLQNDLSKQLQSAISTQKTYNSYASSGNVYVESQFHDLERELKANLSRQLQDELQRHYGSQVNMGAHSYSIKNGRYSAQANYNTQELDDLKIQLEKNLLQQLRNQYQSTQSSSATNSGNTRGDSSSSSGSSSSSYYTGQQTSRGHTSMYRPTYEAFPTNPEVRPAIPLTDVVSQVQATVDRRLNIALDQIENQYPVDSVTYNNAPNFDTILDNLKEDLKRNLTAILQTTLIEHYGNQEEHNNYYYSSRNVASGGRVANYKLDDLNSLRQQVENNLIQKLGNSIQQQRKTYQTNRSTYSSHQSQSSQSSYDTRYRPDSQKVYTSYVTFQPSYRPENTYTQNQPHGSDNIYNQPDSRPAYRPVSTITNSERPIRYGTYRPQPQPQPQSQQGSYYPSSNVYQTNTDQNQDSQRTEQLEYDYNPTEGNRPSGSGPSSSRGTYASGTNYPSGNSYPSNSGSYPSAGQNNYQTSHSNSESSYRLTAANGEGGVQYVSGGSRPQTEYQAELLNIRDQVQDDVSRQLNTAIQQQKHSTSTYSTSSTSNQVLTDLSEELKRNLTQKIEQALRDHYGRTGVRGGYSVSFSTGGRINPGNYNREQLTTLTNQLQDDLLRQLREGLAAESSRHTSSYSSSGTSYQPVASQGTYGQGSNAYSSYSSGSYRQSYGSGTECCMQGDDATTVSQKTVDEIKQGPQRGDLGKHDDDKQKIEDNKPESVDIEAVPPENVETSTRRLARARPSAKPTTTKPARLEQVPEDDDLEQNVEDLSQQFVQQPFWDQNNQDNFDQLTDGQDQVTDQENFGDQLHQQSSGITQQTVDQLDQDQEDLEQQYEDQNAGRIVQQSTQNRDFPRRYQNPEHYSQNTDQNGIERSRIQQTHQDTDLTQQTYDSKQEHGQNQFLTHERNTPQTYFGVPFGVQTQQHFPTQSQTQNLAQQLENLAHQAQDLTQQTEDLGQQTQDFFQQSHVPSQQTHDLTQRTDNLTQESEDLTQQFQRLFEESLLLAQNPELTQQTEDLTQQTQDLAQQNQELAQQTENLAQQIQYITQQTHDLTQQTQDLSQQSYSPSQTQDLTQKTQDLTQQVHDISRDAGNLFGQQEQNTDSVYQHRGSYSSYSSSQSQHSSYSSGSQDRQVHYATVDEVPLQKASDLEQKHVEPQQANVVQDVSHQARDLHPVEAGETVEDVEMIDTTQKPGFWKRLGGKITKTYNKAKDSIVSVG